jgi:hypothetical protein
LLGVEQVAIDLFEITRSGLGDARRLDLHEKPEAALAAGLRRDRHYGAGMATPGLQGSPGAVAKP